MKPEQLPAPHTLIEQTDGSVLALMFHYLPEDTSYKLAAEDQGYEFCFVAMSEDDPLWDEYFRGDNVLDRWRPTPPSGGWLLAAVGDGQDGPAAAFVRPALSSTDPETGR